MKKQLSDGDKIDLILKTMSEAAKAMENRQKEAKGLTSNQTHQEQMIREQGREEFYTFDHDYFREHK